MLDHPQILISINIKPNIGQYSVYYQPIYYKLLSDTHSFLAVLDYQVS